MLKKLVKYGNSNALVLDKAILELLNIEEGSVLKISTDGRSITLTPHETSNQQQIIEPVTSQYAMLMPLFKERIKNFKNFDPAGEQEILSLYSEQASLLQKIHKNINNVNELQKILNHQYNDAAEYKAAYNNFIKKKSPRLAHLNQLIQEIETQHGYDDHFKDLGEPQRINIQAAMNKDFEEFFAKNLPVTELYAFLNLPEYQHEAQLITEKYKDNYSEAFSKELNNLRYKYEPRLEDIDKQMKEIAKKYEA